MGCKTMRAIGQTGALAAVQLGHISRRLTSSDETRTVGSAEA